MNDHNSSNRDRRRNGWELVDWTWFRAPPDFVAASVYIVCLCLFGAGASVLVGSIWQLLKAAFEINMTSVQSHEAIRNLLLGIGALIGAPFLVWRVLIAQKQTDIARDNHFTDLYTKAIEQLGAQKEVRQTTSETSQTVIETIPNLEVRLGAIYALERIARHSRKDHWAIMEVLCAYVRSNSGQPNTTSPKLSDVTNSERGSVIDAWIDELVAPRVDVQAALTVIGRRTDQQLNWELEDWLQDDRHRYLDLRGTNLQKANLARLNFTYALFKGAHCQGAIFELSQCAWVDFEDAHCEGAIFNQAQCQGAIFEDANCERTWFYGTDCREADFSGANCGLARFYSANCEGASFRDADCDDASFSAGKCEGAYFARATFQDASFARADCKNADFIDSRCERTSFSGTNCEGVKFIRAVITSARFVDSNQLIQEQIEEALIGDQGTQLPDHLVRPKHWPDSYLSESQIDALCEAASKKFTYDRLTKKEINRVLAQHN